MPSFGLILVGIYYHNSKLAQGHEPGSSCDGETFAYRRTDRSGGEDFNGGLILFNPMDLKGEIHKINPVSTIKLKPQKSYRFLAYQLNTVYYLIAVV